MGADPAPLLGVSQSVSGRFWRPAGGDDRLALALAQRLGLPEVLGRVMAARGVTLDDADSFLQPSLRHSLPDPSVLVDMDKAAERLAGAVVDDEPIAIFGDYDVDGATSAAVLVRYLRAVGRDARIYVPDRETEGYGPNAAALERLHAEGICLVVTVDCGILAFDALASAAEGGLDVVVVDHHQAEPRLPAARAVVNPNRIDDESNLGGLAAVGLAFLFAIAVNRRLRDLGWFSSRREPDLLQWLDLVALGTVCDVVPLKGLNRVLVAQGLKVAARRRNLGLSILADVAGVDGQLSAYHLGFLLGPRVNAGGRIGRSDLGARLLTTEDGQEARTIAEQLDALNRERQAIEEMVLGAAIDAVEAEGQQDAPLILVGGENWHQGVVGIVASRLKDRYRRPAFALCDLGDTVKGSGRSMPGIDLGAAVTAARQAGLLLAGGGHAMAAGITVEAARLKELQAFLNDRIARQAQNLPRQASLTVDAVLAARAASRDLLDTLEQIGPFGAGHAEPRFAVPGCNLVRCDIVGNGHVRVIATGGDGGRIQGIAFRAANGPLGQALLENRGMPLHLAGHLRANDWRGRRDVQLVIDDAARP